MLKCVSIKFICMCKYAHVGRETDMTDNNCLSYLQYCHHNMSGLFIQPSQSSPVVLLADWVNNPISNHVCLSDNIYLSIFLYLYLL